MTTAIEASPHHLSPCDTPCLMLDMDMLQKNLETMQAFALRHGKALRPHAKTHKCSTLALHQMHTGAIGICVAKVSEAEKLAAAGLRDILITGPVATAHKMERMMQVRESVPALKVVIDSKENAIQMESMLAARGLVMDVLLDIDVGLHRTGVPYAEVFPLAQHIHTCPHLRLRGIQAYAGHLQHVASYEERTRASIDCLQQAAALFRQIQTLSPTSDIFSTTGTGTFDIDVTIPEITDFQVGSYVCMDAEYRSIGSNENTSHFETFAPALRVRTTVVSANQDDCVTVDAGLKSIYRDGGMPEVYAPSSVDYSYDWFGDEYGRITWRNGATKPAIGSILEIIPAHCDPTINLFSTYVMVRAGKVVDIWPIDLQGCSQ